MIIYSACVIITVSSMTSLQLHSYNHTPSLLRMLSSFWTWSDSSVLRVLLKSNSEAVSLLDKFDAQTDLSQQLACYPLPSPSSCMASSDDSTHTVLAIKCAQQYYQCLLKHVFAVRSQMIEKFEIIPHSLQLLATKNSSTILYWLIPKSMVALISAKVVEYGSVLYAEGILEVSIFPGTRITTQAVNLSGYIDYHIDFQKFPAIRYCANIYSCFKNHQTH